MDASDPQTVAAFWSSLLGLEAEPAGDGATGPRGDLPDRTVWVNAVPEPKTVKNRWHGEFNCDDVEELVRRGATPLRGPDGDNDWHVLADPEGTEFCVFTSS